MRRHLAFFLALALLTAGGSTARADEAAAACIAAADRGQVERDEGKLLEARARFSKCGADACPAVVRKECVAWLADVDARLPTLIVSVEGGVAGTDLVGASVSIDGVPRADATSGRAMPVDPGVHVVRASHPAHRSTELRVVVREREKGRLLKLRLEPVDAPPSASTTTRGPTALTWALGGVSVAGFVGFGVLWSSVMSDVEGLRGSCAPYCAAESIDDVRPRVLGAQIALGVGVAAALGAVVSALVPRDAPPRAAAAAR